ncbi:MAG: hypothetical protein E7379_00980 [Clostridiales bacterium]|nr:hypothetical protein [Clostridiales bacterium]
MYNQYRQDEWERFNFNCCKRIVDKIQDDSLALYYFLKQISYNRELLARVLRSLNENTLFRLKMFANEFGDKKFIATIDHHLVTPDQQNSL